MPWDRSDRSDERDLLDELDRNRFDACEDSLRSIPTKTALAMIPPERNAAVRALFSLGLEDFPVDLPWSGGDEFGLEDPLGTEGAERPAPLGEQTGDRIGRYELVELLGEGGFGVVWRARQTEPIRREVALKLLKPGMDSREIIARFHSERQSLALMEHPHIAAVLDAGATDGGRLYFVMERVDGLPLTEYCDSRCLRIADRIALFLDVCDAVQHAHRKGLIHRDLKPSNLLVAEVDGHPIPKVIDFGVAKALHPGGGPFTLGLTRTAEGFLVGTPLYMSPEQAGSTRDIDVRSDVYSLGAVLHELLTGKTPMGEEEVRQAAPDSVLRRIREEEFAKPSSRVQLAHKTNRGIDASDPIMESADDFKAVAACRGTSGVQLRRMLRGELDWIVLRALEKDRERRYQSVGELAADLRRYLAGEAVAAGPPSGWYRFRKLVRRNRGLFFGIGAGAAALIVGLVLASWQALRAATAERIAESRLEMAEQARDAAERLLAESDSALRRQFAAGRSETMVESIGGATRYLDSLPSELENRATSGYRIKFGLAEVAGAAFEGHLEETREHLDALIALVGSLAESEAVTEQEEIDFTTALILGAHAFGEARDYEASGEYRRLVRERSEAWLRREPDAPWALASLGHEAASAALEAAFHTRELQAGLPHIARLKLLELRLSRVAPGSVEHLQIRGLSLFCDAFAAHHLGRPQAAVIGLFEDAAATFRLAYEHDDGNPYREFFFRDFQLGAQTAAGIRLIDLGLAEPDSEKVERGRNLVIDAYGHRLELALADPSRLEWWKDLAGSCKQLVKVAEVSESEEVAANLIARAIETSRLFPSQALDHPVTAFTLSNALVDVLDWGADRGLAWTNERCEILLLALDTWRCGASKLPDFYGSHKDLDTLMKYSLAASEGVGGASIDEAMLRDGLEALRSATVHAAESDPENAALACAGARLGLLLRHGSDGSEEEEARHLDRLAAVAEISLRLHREGAEPMEFNAGLLGAAAEDVRFWIGAKPPERRRALAEAVKARFAPLIAALEVQAVARSGESIPQLQAWGAVTLLAEAEEWIDPKVADEAYRRSLRHFRGALEGAIGPDRENLNSVALMDRHWRTMDRWGTRRWYQGSEEVALSAFAEIVATRETLAWSLSPYHFATLALNQAKCAYLLKSLGRHEECRTFLAAARASVSKVEPGEDSERCEIINLAIELLDLSLSDSSTISGKAATEELAVLVAKQDELPSPPYSASVRRLLDLGWGHYSDSRHEWLDPAARRELLRARAMAREALLASNSSTLLRKALVPLPEVEISRAGE